MWVATGLLLLAMAYTLHLGAFSELVRTYHLWGSLLVVLLFVGYFNGFPISPWFLGLLFVFHGLCLIGIAMSFTPKMTQPHTKGK